MVVVIPFHHHIITHNLQISEGANEEPIILGNG